MGSAERRSVPPAGAANTPWWPTGTPSTCSAGTTGEGPRGRGATTGGGGRAGRAEGSGPGLRGGDPGTGGTGWGGEGAEGPQHSSTAAAAVPLRFLPQEDDAERPAALRREGLLVVQVGAGRPRRFPPQLRPAVKGGKEERIPHPRAAVGFCGPLGLLRGTAPAGQHSSAWSRAVCGRCAGLLQPWGPAEVGSAPPFRALWAMRSHCTSFGVSTKQVSALLCLYTVSTYVASRSPG